MDRNSITGIVLITVILGAFYWINKPSEEEIAAQKRYQDSIYQVELAAEHARIEAEEVQSSKQLEITTEATPLDSISIKEQKKSKFGIFHNAVDKEITYSTIENELIKVTLSNKGGKVYSVELKEYKTYDDQPLILFNGENNSFGFTFSHNNRIYNTNELFFDVKNVSTNSISYTLKTESGQDLAYSYNLPESSYMVDFAIDNSRISDIITSKSGGLELQWNMDVLAQEKGRTFEQRYSGIYYKYYQDEVDNISAAKSASEDIRTKLKWIAYKDQFFSSVLISKDVFTSANISAEVSEDETDINLMKASTTLSIPSNRSGVLDFQFYFGPNNFTILKKYEDLDLQKLVYLGWGFLRYINLVVIKVFNFLEGYLTNYGLIILLLTLLIKMILFPLTYKSYISTAKMKVLRPQIDEINKKIPKDKAMERQQATMALYRKAGVNPMGGCLPMLLQMPILFAMFQFFPASIELRQQSFLWATDLSSYDSIFSWSTNIPLLSTFYGNHISLFTILMSGTNIIYTYMNQEMTQSSNQMPGMKNMMYIMPIVFLGVFNNYAAGLSYYYFISTLITIIQTLVIRKSVNEEAILAKLTANQKKPKAKSKFQARLEEMQKQQRSKQPKKK